MNGLVKIKISVCSAYPPADARNRRLFNFLRSQQFEWKNLPDSDRAFAANWTAFTYEGEGEEVKNLLRRHGFADSDFSINVEYQRGWGFL